MSIAENKALVRRFLEGVWNEGNLDLIEECVAPSYVNHDPSVEGHLPGPEVYRRAAVAFHTFFPDLHSMFEDILAEGDKVVVHGTGRFTHATEFMGVQPTGKQVTVAWICIYRVSNGQIVEQWMSSDSLGMLQQLDVILRQQPTEPVA